MNKILHPNVKLDPGIEQWAKLYGPRCVKLKDGRYATERGAFAVRGSDHYAFYDPPVKRLDLLKILLEVHQTLYNLTYEKWQLLQSVAHNPLADIPGGFYWLEHLYGKSSGNVDSLTGQKSLEVYAKDLAVLVYKLGRKISALLKEYDSLPENVNAREVQFHLDAASRKPSQWVNPFGPQSQEAHEDSPVEEQSVQPKSKFGQEQQPQATLPEWARVAKRPHQKAPAHVNEHANLLAESVTTTAEEGV